MNNITLNIFTNCHSTAPSTKIIKKCYDSFCDEFGKIDAVVWVDQHPNSRHLQKYIRNLFKIHGFKVVNITNSLSDGYIQAIKFNQTDFCFMLEGDWKFLGKINHSLDEIIYVMKSEKLFHLRFNKRENRVMLWDKWLDERFTKVNGNIFKYCKTPVISNNPHIIDRKKYLEFISKGYIQRQPGSKGIEEIISKRAELTGAIYGGIGYSARVQHLDGRKS